MSNHFRAHVDLTSEQWVQPLRFLRSFMILEFDDMWLADYPRVISATSRCSPHRTLLHDHGECTAASNLARL